MTRKKHTTSDATERKSTITDVARLAGVGVGTVSRVLNGHQSVGDDKRRRIAVAIAELRYTPDIVARSLRSNRTMTFACVMRDFKVPVLATFVEAMQREVDTFGFSLLVASSYHDSQREIALLHGFQQRRIDGLVIATSSETDQRLLGSLSQMEIPIVLIDREQPMNADAVCVNHADGVRKAVNYLLDIGHKQIAMISGADDVHPTRSRVEGFTAALQARGVSYRPDLLRLGSFGTDAAYAEARRMLEGQDRPTAIIAGGTALLPGVIRATRELGLVIPRDVSVIGGSDSDLAQLSEPAFTVVRWSHDRLGKAAGRFLIQRHAQPDLAPQRMAVDAELIVRGSCGRPPR